jgi:hypothetical protein
VWGWLEVNGFVLQVLWFLFVRLALYDTGLEAL